MRGGLTLDSKSGWEDAVDPGPAVSEGKPEESLIIWMLRWPDDEHQMTPREKLPASSQTHGRWHGPGTVFDRIAVTARFDKSRLWCSSSLAAR